MLTNEFLFLGLFLAVTIGLAIPLGSYMAKVYEGQRTVLSGLLLPIERLLYGLCGVDEREEMNWKSYALAAVFFTVLGGVLLFIIEMMQGWLPLNPQNIPGMRWDTALNTAISFMTNTNWQSYVGEQAMSYFTQMVGLAVHNFLSAAIGMACLVAMIRGFSRKTTDLLGNFWVDMTRSVLYILMPLSVIFSLIFLTQGMPQTFRKSVVATTLEGQTQTIAMGPVASQISIKQLGSNGGGFFNANSAHPFENPTSLTNFLETLAILLIPMALVFMFGAMIGNKKQGRAIFIAMLLLYLLGLGVILWAELQPDAHLQGMGVTNGMNMEGKEERFGIVKSALWEESTTVTSNGSVNAMHDSSAPLAGLVQMTNMGLGEIIFGGVGVGLIGMFFHVLLTMFVVGLMIGRIPEFLGKKLGVFEMVMSVLGLVGPSVAMLTLGAIAIAVPAGLAGLNNPSAHGLSEILYAYTSAVQNNGSAFAGLGANTVFFNLTLAVNMLIGRFIVIIPALAIAGSVAQKKVVPSTSATFPTTNWLFVIVLMSVILIMGGLTFFPVYTLGPILDHFFLLAGKAF